MDSKRLPIPPLSRPVRFGQPYHGLLVNGSLTLSTGATIEWPGAPYGDAYRFEVPGTSLTMDPAEVAIEAALGREWRSVALLTGHMRNYAGIVVGSNAWLYGAPDGTVWRIECDKLDVMIDPTPGIEGAQWPFPETLDFGFSIRRFGLIDPDDGDGNDAPTIARIVEGQSLGGVFLSDPTNTAGTIRPATQRRNLWYGDSPVLVLNIEDISSDGSKVLIGVNRSIEQSALAGSLGRAVPYSWLRVTVAGTGDEVTVSMGVEAVRTYEISASSEFGAPMESEHWVKPLSDDPPYKVPADGRFPYFEEWHASWSRGGQIVGLYFGTDDEVLQVRTGAINGSTIETGYVEISASQEIHYGTYHRAESLSAVTIYHGVHGVSFPALSLTFEETMGGDDPQGPSLTVTGGVLAPISATVQNWYTPDWGMYMNAAVFPRWPWKYRVINGASEGWLGSGRYTWDRTGLVVARPADFVCVTRVTNKVYAVVVAAPDDIDRTPHIEGAFHVLAIGTPAGWITGPAIESHWKASYNPITNQLATCGAGDSRGWV